VVPFQDAVSTAPLIGCASARLDSGVNVIRTLAIFIMLSLAACVDRPAENQTFQLTLWQSGKEVKTYQIGIGRKEFPLPSGLRRTTQIVYNPEWVPPDSSWVEAHDVTPGERIEAEDPRNPLGKIKIPLGNGILIHQASGESDLGHLVSHGCVRLLTDEEWSRQISATAHCGNCWIE